MKKNKLILGAAAFLALVTMSACSGNNQNIATFRGGQVTVEDFFDQAKMTQANQGMVREMIVYGVFMEQYGSKVSDEDVTKEFNNTKEQQGENFAAALQQAGFTEASFKHQIRQNLALQAGLKAHVNLTDEDLRAAWESFHPEVEAQIIQASSEEDAKAILEEVKKDGADFGAIAKEKSTDTVTREDGGKVKFDSTSTEIPQEVQQAAFALKDGEISDVITVTSPQTFATTYYIVKMVATSDKGNDMSKFQEQVEEIATQTQLSDQTFQTRVIGEVLKAAHVKIEDDAFAHVLADFMPQTTDDTQTTETSE